MSVVRGRPPGLAGGIRGASRAYCSSLSACPAPKSPTKARFSAVHMACLQEGLLPFPKPPARPLRLIICLDRAGFSNGLLEVRCFARCSSTAILAELHRRGLIDKATAVPDPAADERERE